LTGEELNALVRNYADMHRISAQVAFAITGQRLEAHATTTLGNLGVPVLKRRHLNAVALLKISVYQGVLRICVEELKVRGRRVPGWVQRRLGKINLAAGLRDNPRTTLMFERIEAIRVEGGKLVVVPETQ
jgi:hypothetical protein